MLVICHCPSASGSIPAHTATIDHMFSQPNSVADDLHVADASAVVDLLAICRKG